MASIIEYIMLTARRDWLFLGVFILMVLVILGGVIIGGTSVVEQTQTVTALVAGSVRYLMVFGISLFTCFHIKRSFDNREIDFFLSKPITRTKFVISYLIGISVIMLGMVIPTIIFMMSVKQLGLFYGLHMNYLAWGLSLIMEMIIVVSFAIFASLLLKSSIAAMLATMGFYLFSRIVGYFFTMVSNPAAVGKTTILGKLSSKIMWLLSMIFPRLDQFTQSEWLIYGVSNWSEYAIFLGSGLIYVTLITLMSLFDFRRHEF
jgi:ABC-type transport system involved in multi-copper enzyme maturation permease subunit